MTPAPSPTTTRRKRIARLKRTFGEEVPECMLTTITPVPSRSRVQSLRKEPSFRASPTNLVLISPIDSDASGTEDDTDWVDVHDSPPTERHPPRVSSLKTDKTPPARPPEKPTPQPNARKRVSKPPFSGTSITASEGASRFLTRWTPTSARLTAKRRSAKWTQIKGGQEVESGYAEVIQALREL